MTEVGPSEAPDYAEIFKQGWARQDESGATACGPGSLPSHTVSVRRMLARIIADFDVTSINDVGCGDLAWMEGFVSAVRTERELEYTGYDVCEWQPNWIACAPLATIFAFRTARALRSKVQA